jgi:hypothetical protein
MVDEETKAMIDNLNYANKELARICREQSGEIKRLKSKVANQDVIQKYENILYDIKELIKDSGI